MTVERTSNKSPCLLIEDEEILINLLDRKLTQEGYEVFLTRNGMEGLEKMREVKPDLILLDIIMPKMGGMEVMEEMQKDEELRKIPVLVISNSGQPVTQAQWARIRARRGY